MQKKLMMAVLAVVLIVASGCATKKYVREELQTVNNRVDEVEGQVEQNQTDIRENQETIERQEEELANLSKTSRDALERADAAGKLAEGKFLYEVAMTDDKVRFQVDQAKLSEEAMAFLDGFANSLKEQNKNVYIEIQGHTDNVGGEDYNYQLGLDRAEAVRRYLNSAGGVALHRMSVISYGENEPVTGNDTREGRKQNRRVVLVVLQ